MSRPPERAVELSVEFSAVRLRPDRLAEGFEPHAAHDAATSASTTVRNTAASDQPVARLTRATGRLSQMISGGLISRMSV